MSAVDVTRHRETASRPTVGGRVDAGNGVAAERHEAGVGRIARLQEGEQIDIVPCEAVEVLQEQLQFISGKRFIVSVVAHLPTVGLAKVLATSCGDLVLETSCWRPPRPELRAGEEVGEVCTGRRAGSSVWCWSARSGWLPYFRAVHLNHEG